MLTVSRKWTNFPKNCGEKKSFIETTLKRNYVCGIACVCMHVGVVRSDMHAQIAEEDSRCHTSDSHSIGIACESTTFQLVFHVCGGEGTQTQVLIFT